MNAVKKLMFTTSIAFAIAASLLAMTAKALGLSQGDADTTAAGFDAKAASFIGAGLAVGLAGLGSSIGMGTAGAAAIGAISEDKSLFGNALVFVVLIEAVAIYGLLVALLLIFASGV